MTQQSYILRERVEQVQLIEIKYFQKTDRLLNHNKEQEMSIAKVTEISSSSDKSFDDAIARGIKRASKTIRNIEGAWIQDQKLVIKKDKITEYRVKMKVSFILEE